MFLLENKENCFKLYLQFSYKLKNGKLENKELHFSFLII